MNLEREARQLVVDIVETYNDEGFAAAHQLIWDYLVDLEGNHRDRYKELEDEIRIRSL